MTFEFSPIHKNRVKEFSVSADGIEEAFPAVQSLVKVAPKIKNWQINAFRQRTPGDDIQITYDSLKISYDDISFQYTLNAEKIDVQLKIKDFNDTPSYKNATYILLDGLIGEYDTVTRIGNVTFERLDTARSDSYHKLIELRTVVDSLKRVEKAQ